MYRHKLLGKRGLSLFMAVMMCMSLVNFTVFATDGHVHNEDGWVCTQGDPVKTLTCDRHVHGEDCYKTERGEQTCTVEEHTHGEDCYTQGEDVLACTEVEHTHTEDCFDEDGEQICTVEEHQHGENCYTQGEAVLTCTETEHTHGDECYEAVTVKVCGEEDHKHGEDCYTETPGEWISCTNVVGNFLAAAAALPAAKDVTPDNAAEIGEQVNAVLDMADALREDYYARADVTEALETVYAVFTAVLEAEKIDEGSTYDAGTSSVVKSADSAAYPQTSRYNVCGDGWSDNWAETGYGQIKLANVGDTVTDDVFMHYYRGHNGVAYPLTYTNLSVESNSNPEAVRASVTQENGHIKVTFEKKAGYGAATIVVGYTCENMKATVGLATDSDWYCAVSGQLVYTVGGDSTAQLENTSVYSVLINLDNGTYKRYTNGNWSGTPQKAGSLTNGAMAFGEDYSVPSSYGNLYARNLRDISLSAYDLSVATVGADRYDWTGIYDYDAAGVNAKGPRFTITGREAGTTSVVCTTVCELPDYIWNGKVYYADYSWETTINIKVIKTEPTTTDITLTYHDGNLTAKDTGPAGEFEVYQPMRENPGYTFKGWAETEEKAKNGEVKWDAGEEYTFTQDTDLYAVWQKNPTVSKTAMKTVKDGDETKDVQITEVQVGEEFFYTIKVHNPNSKAIIVTITDKLNEKLDFVGAGDGGSYDKDTRTVTWTNVTVPANGSKNVTVYVKANAAGEIKNTATVTWPGGGSATGDETVTVPTPVLEITGIEKKLVTKAADVPGDVAKKLADDKVTITYPNATTGKVTIPNGGSVTLLYKITVSGDAGKEYKVTDDKATYVGGDPMEGAIPEGGKAVIYVTRTFTAGDINDKGKLQNMATVTPGKGNESSTSSTETTPAEEASKPVNPDSVWTVNWMKGYETEGEKPWETIPDTVPVKTKTYEGAAQPDQSVIQPDYPATADMQALRGDSKFIGWGTPVVDEENRVITITAKWETTESTNIQFYKTFSGADGLAAKASDDFEVKITITDLVTGKELAKGTLNKANNLDQRLYFDYVVEHGYKITIVESNYEIEGYTFKSQATREDVTEAAPTPAYSEWGGAISGSSGTHGIVNTYAKKAPVIVVDKTNDGLKLDENTGTLKVNYTVKVTNKSGYDLYGLRLTDVMDNPTLTKVNAGDVGEPSVKLTFSDWKVGGADAKLISGNENDLTHVLQLIDREKLFKDNETVTLTYSVEVESLNDEVAVKVELHNVAEGASWSKPLSSPATVANVLRAAIMPLAGALDDEPDMTGPDGSNASTDGDAPDVTGEDDSSTSDTTGSDSGTEGVIPRKYTVTYEWNLPDGATGKTLPEEAKYLAGKPVTVDTANKKDDTVTVDGKTYKFSGWDTDDFTMPAENVTIKGSWEEVIVTPPDPEQVTITLSYDANGGSNAPASESQTVDQGASATFTVKGQESMTRSGYTFQGWATSADGAVAYPAGSSISISKNTTLYAVWSRNTVVVPDPDPDPVTRYTLTINYVYEDGTTAAPTHSSRHDSGYQYSVSSPSIEGYTPDQAVVSGTLTSDVTVTVVYTADGTNIDDENPPLAELPDENPPLSENPEVNIPDENPPLAENPEVDIPDEEPPLAENPEVDIPDEDVPLDATPKTGDDSHTGLWAGLCVVSLLGAVALGRKEEDERA